MEENKVENLSEDETYAKIETEKLLRRKKKRKILTSIALGIALALAIVIIVLSSVPVSLKPVCLSNDFTSVQVFDGNDPKATIYNDGSQKMQYNKFVNAVKTAFSQKYIAALFAGNLGDYDIEENFLDFYSSEFNSGKYVKMHYGTAQKVTNKNGKPYLSRYRTSSDPLTFNNLYFVLNEENKFEDTKIYLNVTYPSGNENKLLVIKVKGNTSKIYDAFKDLF